MDSRFNEKDYQDLYKYSLHVACFFIGNNDTAFDIAQNAMLSLITAKSEIKSPKAWLRTVVKRESIRIRENDKRTSDISIQKLEESVKKKPMEAISDDDAMPEVDDDTAKKALSLEEFRIYQKFKKVKFNIAKYAKNEKLSYNTAAFHKQRIKRNIQSFVLWEDGWRFSNKILSFPQLNNINRFIRSLMKAIEEDKLASMINYLRGVDLERLASVFKDVKECREWSFSHYSDSYHLTMVCQKHDGEFKFPLLNLDFDKKNYLHITQVNEGEILLCVPENKNIALENFTVKGQLDLSVDEAIDLLKYQK
ncbi:MAG TPA: hypothetical protein PLE74_08310 [Candidatus Cloacimonadota bacterium]|nr:hypothetical protein [Candidatus Cloacimonadota bacterium]